ncbi:hypothetical protein X777_16732 [Ooceraea biroi]|uniref:Uncharacterized protein n=1 Tax=Ooceraea biroi TaxID=2015173 RepID=A0A026WVI3_OOCBI|nr:hypothetical protein X777_16732 [Ooceraea biroi]
MQDGATPHRTQEVFETIHKVYGNRVIGLGIPLICPGGARMATVLAGFKSM